MESFLELNSSIQADFLMGSVDLNYGRFSCCKAQIILSVYDYEIDLGNFDTFMPAGSSTKKRPQR